MRGADTPPLAAVSLIDEDGGRRVRMGTLAFLGSHKVNGVSALHTELMRQTVFRDLHTLYPDRIVNKTNGITFRRWLFDGQSRSDRAAGGRVGPRVLDDAAALEGFARGGGRCRRCMTGCAAIRRANKVGAGQAGRRAAGHQARSRRAVRRADQAHPRIQAAVAEHPGDHRAVQRDARPADADWVPRVKIFAGKAAASYQRAKLIIKLINDVARVVNDDPALRGRLKVVFLPDYNVSLAEAIIPAADLSEQISTAGMEASGTGNMKLALNGALTIGTLDGANMEIRDRVGADNMFIFGLTAEQVEERRRHGPGARETDRRVAGAAAGAGRVGTGVFSPDEPQRFRDLVDDLTGYDRFMVTADFDAYAAAQRQVAARWRDRRAWWRSSVLNTAHMGWFSVRPRDPRIRRGDLERETARGLSGGLAPPPAPRQHRRHNGRMRRWI